MNFLAFKLDQNNLYGNALVERDEDGKIMGHSKTFVYGNAANANEPFTVLELEEDQ